MSTATRPRTAIIALLIALCVGLLLAAKDCPNCGTSNSDAARFCKNCGYRFPSTAPRPRELPLIRADVTVSGNLVMVRSTPSGATVRVDGRGQGETPVNVSNLSPGRHEIAVSRSGYRTYYGIFVITKARGTISVTTEPAGAEILLDGKLQGTAGEDGLLIQEVQYGSHTLTARMPGHEDATQVVELTSREPVVVTSLTLVSRFAFLKVESDPPGAALSINGKPVGRTPYVGTPEPGRQLLTISRRGFEDWIGYTDVELGDTAFVFAEMTKHVGPPAFLLWIGGAAIAGGVVATVLGETEYAGYRNPEQPFTKAEAEEAQKSVQQWDLMRNIAVGVGALSVGLYFVF